MTEGYIAALFCRVWREISTPKGGRNYPKNLEEFLGVPGKALRKALHRLKNASPTQYHAELRRVRQEYAIAGGRVRTEGGGR